MSFPVTTTGPQTAADWAALNPTLEQFQFGIEVNPATGAYTKAKFGDGRTAWNDLPYWDPTGGPREVAIESSATPTPNADITDEYVITALGEAAEFAAPTGTPVQGQAMIIRIKDDDTARALSFNAIYRAIGVTLPTTTVLGKTLYIAMIYNATDTLWDVLAVAQEA